MEFVDGFQAQLSCFFLMIVVLLCLCRLHLQKYSKLPPSPFQLPFVGCLPFLNQRFPHLTFSSWATQLGKIYCCRMGRQLVVVLNDAGIVREAFSQSAFNGRPNMYTARLTSQGYGISFASDDTWQIHRKFAVKTLKTLGLGKGVLEERIRDEAQRLVSTIASFEGRPFCNKNLMRTAVANVISGFLFGQSFEIDGKEINDFYGKMDAVFRFFGVAGILNIFPWLVVVPKIQDSFRKVVEALESAGYYIKKIFEEHLDSYAESGLRDYTDAFIASSVNEKSSAGTVTLFTKRQYITAARELFLSGYETTTSTLRWAFLYISAHPEIQTKVQWELDNIVGRSRPPAYSDLVKLPYTQAVLFEVMRICSIGPMGVPHRAVEDTVLAGYTIPKDTWVFSNLWHIHRDSTVWQNATEFLPERFLSADRSLFIPKQFIPFCAGKRSCPGEMLAKLEVFMVFTAVLQRFTLKVDGPANMEPVNGITLDTQDYLMTAVLR